MGCIFKVEIALVFYQTIQVKFDFGPGPMIFDRIMPQNLEKKKCSVQTNVKLNTCMAFEILAVCGDICGVMTNLFSNMEY